MTIEACTGSFYEIPDHAFRNSLVTEVTIPEGIEVIGKGAFKKSGSISSIC